MDSICNEVVWGRGGMADTLVLGTSASACGFESHRPHYVIWFGIHLTHPSRIKLSCKILDGQMRWSDKNASNDIIGRDEQML